MTPIHHRVRATKPSTREKSNKFYRPLSVRKCVNRPRDVTRDHHMQRQYDALDAPYKFSKRHLLCAVRFIFQFYQTCWT